MRRFHRQEDGGVFILLAVFSMIAVGAGALSLDFGRMALLRSQMQDRADAVAMAGATQLDGRDGARLRAGTVALDAMRQYSSMADNGESLDISQINFYSELLPSRILASDDESSKFVEVILQPKTVRYLFEPILNGGASNQGVINARATAASNPYICHVPPLMICDPGEGNPSMDLALPENVGKQIAVKPPAHSGAWVAGNYGLLALPDGSLGASAIETALSAVTAPDCYTLDVSTATGVKTKKIQDGINARFDLPGGHPYPAPNVINYPRDPEIITLGPTGTLGSGNWDIDTYWLARHGTTVPSALADAPRYQAYLYELGVEYARNGKHTIYPIEGTLPPGYTVVTPPGEDIPVDIGRSDDPDYDGVPDQEVASNGHARRLVQIAVLQCIALGVRGSHTYPTNGNFVEMFITETVPDAPAGGIYAEIVTPLSPTTDPDFYPNVTLVE